VSTKPDKSMGCLPVWSGRALPKDSLVNQLPYLVQAAQDYARRKCLVRLALVSHASYSIGSCLVLSFTKQPAWHVLYMPTLLFVCLLLFACTQPVAPHLCAEQVSGLLFVSPDGMVGKNKGSLDDDAIRVSMHQRCRFDPRCMLLRIYQKVCLIWR
jgi:hypothetical protein